MYNKVSGNWLKHRDFMFLDIVFLQAAYILSYMIRNGFVNPYEREIYLNIGIIICFADICAAFFLDGYKGIIRRGYFMEFKAVAKHVFTICIFMILYLFLTKNSEEFSRMSFMIFAGSSLIILYAERTLWKFCIRRYRKDHYNQKALLILTSYDAADHTIHTVRNNSYNEIRVAGLVLTDRDDLVGERIGGEKVVCTCSDLYDFIRTEWVDGILVNVKDKSSLPDDMEETCIRMGVNVYIKLSEVDEDIYNQKIEKIAGYVVVSSGISSAGSGEMFLKRLMDIIGAVIGLVFTGILFLIFAPAIKFQSPGPVIFSQIRIGKNGRKFKIYKFRSMYTDAEQKKVELAKMNQMKGNMFKMYHDPRIIGSGPDGTKHGLGWFIRKTSIDEFPQFWNVLKGDMSLVGARPPTVDEWEKYKYHHRARLAMKPGITGIWQVSGRSDVIDFEEIVKMDMEYIQNWDIGLDIKILLKTFRVVLSGDGAG